MSCFVLKEEMVSGVVNSLLDNSYLTADTQMHKKELFNYLMNCNVIAYNERYNETGGLDCYTYNPNVKLSDIQLLKTLCCLNYQLIQDNVPEQIIHIHNVINKDIQALQAKIINTLPEYKSAEWD